jgi:hypothetical protein
LDINRNINAEHLVSILLYYIRIMKLNVQRACSAMLIAH